jgi:peptidoglycan/xylan/chitin deacetylase (PgdA/CDA1 family)
MFGAQPVLFRPPGGFYNADTLAAAWDAGHQVVVLWTLTPSQVAAGAPVRRGDIILHHFDATLESDLQVTLAAIAAAGLTPAWLEDYVR